MLTVHHLENSRSQRVLWLLEELGASYEIVRYERDPKTSLAPDALRDVHPLGKAPVVTDGEITVAESGAIVEYLTARYGDGSLVPPEASPERLRYTFWLHYAEGSFMPFMILSLVLTRIEGARVPFFLKPVTRGIADKVRKAYVAENVSRHLAFMQQTLSESTWFAGERFTAADVQMSFALEAAEVRTNLSTEYPALAGFLERIRARPAYRAALEKGGPYELLGG
ncbi:MAG: glutathione S-transferase [Pseudomonadota bacterium]